MQCKLSLYTWTSVSQSHIPNQIIWKTIQSLNVLHSSACMYTTYKTEVCKDDCVVCYSVSVTLHLLCVQQKVNALTSLCLLKRIKCDKSLNETVVHVHTDKMRRWRVSPLQERLFCTWRISVPQVVWKWRQDCNYHSITISITKSHVNTIQQNGWVVTHKIVIYI